VVQLTLSSGGVRNDDLTATAQSLQAFCEEAKENTSVQFFSLGLDPNYDGIIFNLNQFLLFSVGGSGDFISNNQAHMIASAIENRQLELLDLTALRFDSCRSSEIVLAACTKVIKLQLCCVGYTDPFHLGYTDPLDLRWAAVSSLLQNPTAVLTSLSIEWAEGSEYGLPLIAASLNANTRLKHLTMSIDEHAWELEEWNLDVLGPVLCDSSSTESIFNSNHTLQNIDVCQIARHIILRTHVRASRQEENLATNESPRKVK
jgi:hypothetical protein